MNSKTTAIVVLVIGLGLLFWGYQESQVLGNQLSRSLTNKWDTTTMILFIAGSACTAFGLFRLFRK
ncbi:MAG: DUF3185 family protein [Alcanivoracaceae bacterium]|nr:DUF3185 family protein [Alcanivoracaceae bacterium]